MSKCRYYQAAFQISWYQAGRSVRHRLPLPDAAPCLQIRRALGLVSSARCQEVSSILWHPPLWSSSLGMASMARVTTMWWGGRPVCWDLGPGKDTHRGYLNCLWHRQDKYCVLLMYWTCFHLYLLSRTAVELIHQFLCLKFVLLNLRPRIKYLMCLKQFRYPL